MDDVNETIDLDHDIEGLEEVPSKGRLGIRTIPCVLWWRGKNQEAFMCFLGFLCVFFWCLEEREKLCREAG